MSRRKVKKAWKKISEGKPVSEKEINMITNYTSKYFRYLFQNKLDIFKPRKINDKSYFIPCMLPYIKPEIELIDIPEKDRDFYESFKDAICKAVSIDYQVPIEILKGKYNGKN